MRATIFESCFSTRSLRLPKTLVRILGIGLGFAIPGCGRYSIGHHKRTRPSRLELAARPGHFKPHAPPCRAAGTGFLRRPGAVPARVTRLPAEVRGFAAPGVRLRRSL